MDIPELLSLNKVKETGKALMVVTRSQTQGLQPAEQGESSDSSSRVRPTQEPEVAT